MFMQVCRAGHSHGIFIEFAFPKIFLQIKNEKYFFFVNLQTKEQLSER